MAELLGCKKNKTGLFKATEIQMNAEYYEKKHQI